LEPQPDGSLRASFRAPVNDGLLKWVLAYGSHVKVLSPGSLRAQVREELARGHARYSAPVETEGDAG